MGCFLMGHEHVYKCSWILSFVKDAIFEHTLITFLHEFCVPVYASLATMYITTELEDLVDDTGGNKV